MSKNVLTLLVLVFCLSISLEAQISDVIYINLSKIELSADPIDKETVVKKVKELASAAQAGTLIFVSNGPRPLFHMVPSVWNGGDQDFENWEYQLSNHQGSLPTPSEDLDTIFDIAALNGGLNEDAEVSFIINHEIVLREEIANLVDWICLSLGSHGDFSEVVYSMYITEGSSKRKKIREQIRDEVSITELND